MPFHRKFTGTEQYGHFSKFCTIKIWVVHNRKEQENFVVQKCLKGNEIYQYIHNLAVVI